MSANKIVLHKGGCHCGAVKWEVEFSENIQVLYCNCSICNKKQNYHFIVPVTKFRLLQGENNLTTYTFNTHQAKHKFCSVCGVQSFYIPRSNPDGIGVMPHCIDSGTVKKITTRKFDGTNWDQAMIDYPSIVNLSI